MPRTDWGWQVTPEELTSWIVYEDDSLFVVDKPAHLVCHPSKKGPWSSLIGACREYLGSERLHLVSRLDRETSGLVVVAKTQPMARLLQTAVQERTVSKTYKAILEGRLLEQKTVDQPIGKDERSPFAARQWVVPNGQCSTTIFTPVEHTSAYTLASVDLLTGRRHQIRVHAAWIGHPIVGDKLYGPDESLMFRFISEGFTAGMQDRLKLDRQALHAETLCFGELLNGRIFCAPLPIQLTRFWEAASAG